MSSVRAWLFLVWLSFRRMGWTWQALAAIVLIVAVAGLVFAAGVVNFSSEWPGWNVSNFTRQILIGAYLGFLLPLLCLCFGTQALGGDWEEKTFVWLLSRPLPRWSIYLAKFTAAIPWTVGLALAGLFLLGAAAGEGKPVPTPPRLLASLMPSLAVNFPEKYPGWVAATTFWPVVAIGSVAYLSLFVLLGTMFRRSTIIAVAYTFVIEVIVANMPGLLKRASVQFYNNCLVYDYAKAAGWDQGPSNLRIAANNEVFYLPVAGETALLVLAVASTVLILLGAWVFGRSENQT
jgi:hypothetical protein